MSEAFQWRPGSREAPWYLGAPVTAFRANASQPSGLVDELGRTVTVMERLRAPEGIA